MILCKSVYSTSHCKRERSGYAVVESGIQQPVSKNSLSKRQWVTMLQASWSYTIYTYITYVYIYIHICVGITNKARKCDTLSPCLLLLSHAFPRHKAGTQQIRPRIMLKGGQLNSIRTSHQQAIVCTARSQCNRLPAPSAMRSTFLYLIEMPLKKANNGNTKQYWRMEVRTWPCFWLPVSERFRRMQRRNTFLY